MELLEIEKELAGADGQSALKRYDEILVGLAQRAKAAMDYGLEPDEFDKCRELSDVVTIARKLLRLQMQSPKQETSTTH